MCAMFFLKYSKSIELSLQKKCCTHGSSSCLKAFKLLSSVVRESCYFLLFVHQTSSLAPGCVGGEKWHGIDCLCMHNHSRYISISSRSQPMLTVYGQNIQELIYTLALNAKFSVKLVAELKTQVFHCPL